MPTKRTRGPGQPTPPPWPAAPDGWRWCRKGNPCQLQAPDGWTTANYNYPERALAEAQRRIISQPKPKEQPMHTYSIDQAAAALRSAGYTVRPHGARYLVATQGGNPSPLTSQELISMAAAQTWIAGESPLAWTAVCGQCGQSFISDAPVADGAICPSCVGTVASDAPAPAAPHTLPLIELLPALEAHAQRLPRPLPRDYVIPLPAGLPALFDAPIDLIATSRYQPRTTFDDGDLDDLAASIAQHGIQTRPIVFANERGQLELVAGERRLRAARKLGMQFIPVDVRSYSLQTAFELAGVDNIQRAGLNQVEEGSYFNRLISELGISENELSKRLGKNRAYIQQRRAVASSAPELIRALAEGAITFSVARGIALAAPGDHKAQQSALKQVQAWTKNGRTVSEAEARAETEKLLRKRLEADLKRLGWHISGAGEIWAPGERPKVWTGAEMLEAVKAQRQPAGVVPEGVVPAADLQVLQWQHDQISHACAPWVGLRKSYSGPWAYLAPDEVPALAAQIRAELAALQARVQARGFTIDPGSSTYTRIEVKGSHIREVVYSWASLEECVGRIEAGNLADRPLEQQHAPARQTSGMKCGGCGKKTGEGLMYLGGKGLCAACRAPVLAQQKAEREAREAAKAAAEAQIRQRVDGAIGAWLRSAPAGALPLVFAALAGEPVEVEEADDTLDRIVGNIVTYIDEWDIDNIPTIPTIATLLGLVEPAAEGPADDLPLMRWLAEESPLYEVAAAVMNLANWQRTSLDAADDEELRVTLNEAAAIRQDLEALAPAPDVSDTDYEQLSTRLGSIEHAIRAARAKVAEVADAAV